MEGKRQPSKTQIHFLIKSSTVYQHHRMYVQAISVLIINKKAVPEVWDGLAI